MLSDEQIETIELINKFKDFTDEERLGIVIIAKFLPELQKKGLIKDINNIQDITESEKQKVIEYITQRLKENNKNGKETRTRQ